MTYRSAIRCSVAALGLAAFASTVPAQSQPLTIKRAVRYDAPVLGFDTGGLQNQNDNFGTSAAAADLDGDGRVELFLGHWRDDDVDDPAKLGSGKYNNNGALWVVKLNADGTVASTRKLSAADPEVPPLDVDNGPPGVSGEDAAGVRGFGWAVDSLGDVDGDGVPDLVVGVNEDDDGTTGKTCPNGTCSNPNIPIDVGYGSIYILFMRADGSIKSWQKISKTTGGNLGALLSVKDYFGASVASMGDFNGDGFQDILVGAPGTHKSNPTTGGEPFNPPLTLPGQTPEEYQHVASTGLGRVWILSIHPDGTLYRSVPLDLPHTPGGLFLNGAASNEYGDEFGQSVAWLGDLDGDTPGTEENPNAMTHIAVGAPQDDEGPQSPQGRYGAVWILGIDMVMNQGGVEVPTIVESQKLSALRGNLNIDLHQRDLFGMSLDRAGDWNKDGVPDLIVGASRDDDGKADSGSAFLLLMRPDMTVGAVRKMSDTPNGVPDTLVSNGKGVNFGTAVASVGDFDGNGTGDFVVGAELYDNLDRGAAWLLTTDVPRIKLGDRVDADIPASGSYRFTFEAARGTKLKMTAIQRPTASGKAMEPGLRILGPLVEGQIPDVIAGLPDTVTTKKSPKAKRRSKLPKGLTVPETGHYLVEIFDVGGQGGTYRLKTAGKPAKDVRKVTSTVAVGSSEEVFPVEVTATSGSLLKKLAVKTVKPKGTFAVIDGQAAELFPVLDTVLDPGHDSVAIRPYVKVNATGTAVSLRKLPLDHLGDYVFEVGGAGGSVGYASFRASVKIPRSRERYIFP